LTWHSSVHGFVLANLAFQCCVEVSIKIMSCIIEILFRLIRNSINGRGPFWLKERNFVGMNRFINIEGRLFFLKMNNLAKTAR